jgi:hypothetical protein
VGTRSAVNFLHAALDLLTITLAAELTKERLREVERLVREALRAPGDAFRE